MVTINNTKKDGRQKESIVMCKKIIRPTLPSLPTLDRVNKVLMRLSIAAAPLMAFIAIMPGNTRWL